MFDTRLIYQVVEWERRMQIENEKQGNHQLVLVVPFSNSLEACCKAVKYIYAQICKLNQGSTLSNHSSEQNGTLESHAYNAS
jgi:hypothetical protein